MNNQHPLFLELRSKFENDLLNRCQKDGTYLENISLSGVFYRLAKGSISFEKVYMTKTYKGLIYLSKCGKSIDNADDITQFLTDEQLVKLNITPALRWKNTINRTNTNADSLSFIERMGLQLLLFFGHDKGKYLLELNMQGNRMENLFDGLQYGNISIKENGEPIINQELIDYLFGRGKMREKKEVDEKYFLADEKLDKFKYLKGSKRIPRKKPNGDSYIYSEGSMSFPDNLDIPARTMLTSESGLSRMTHVIEDYKTKKLRLLTPIECERINGFPDNWTNTGMTDKRRYFMMGNALVIGIVAKIGIELEKIIDNED